jgi:hypothetical protein
MENEFPAACRRIDVFGEALEANVSTVQFSDSLYEVFEGSAKPVKPPHNEGIPCPDVVEGFGEGSVIPVMLANSFYAMVAQTVDSTPGAHHEYGHPRGRSALQIRHG